MINHIEADFLTHCIDAWANDVERVLTGRPLMFTTQDREEEEGGEERVLLTHDQIEALFLRLRKHAA